MYSTIISAQDLHTYYRDPSWRIFDCRFYLKDPNGGLTKYREGHIPGAQYANLDVDLASPMTATSGRHPLPNPDALMNKLQKWGVNTTSQVVAYDDLGGAFAARMWWLLRWLGHKQMVILEGGIEKWLHGGYPLEQTIPAYPGGNFTGAPNQQMWVNIEFVEQGLANHSIKLVDARASDRFTGRDKQTDPVPGHVPGATNLPFAGNLTAQGLFKSPAELSQRFTQVFGDTPAEQRINMCGSGVTACHNLLAMEIANMPGAKLYIGSWSEWIRSGSRPVATGD